MVNIKEISLPTKAKNTSNADEGRDLISYTKQLKSASSSDSNDAEEKDSRNTSKKRRSFSSFSLSGMLQMMDPEPETPTRSSSNKKWMSSKRGRKFSFASTEEYMKYAGHKSISGEFSISSEFVLPKNQENDDSEEMKVKKTEKKEENRNSKETETSAGKSPKKENNKNSEETKVTVKKYRSKKLKKYRKSSRFSFSSSEEYIEYFSAKKQEEETLRRAKKRNTQSTEFEALDDTADVTVFSAARDIDVDYEEEEYSDVEANNVSEDTNGNNNGTMGKRKCCLPRKLTFSDVWRIMAIWVLIVVITLILSKFGSWGWEPQETPLLGVNTTATCSLCSSGFSVHKPELEVVLGDFTCTLEESLTPTKYTCGEIEKFLSDSASECVNNDEACSDFVEASIQCCFQDSDEILEKQLKQTQGAIDHFQKNGY